eukprot:CAMPEP_0178903650 /NCGR_PEP_ID=MMETSP0786-20121207/5270_1 /TAXON_ID=186022 /ORGANISM="Thalassionema frauenfeldii, Strain CCMP 1798" /LENGTH=431 /DNA_ID=CAMNT_0020575035 /DNA_START=235 /DNA_END=1527 /DNA_ORIENTATION=+
MLPNSGRSVQNGQQGRVLLSCPLKLILFTILVLCFRQLRVGLLSYNELSNDKIPFLSHDNTIKSAQKVDSTIPRKNLQQSTKKSNEVHVGNENSLNGTILKNNKRKLPHSENGNIKSSPRNEPRLPMKPFQRITKSGDKVLVVYSGPTDLLTESIVQGGIIKHQDRKTELYRKNFEHFLKYGVQCKTQDTVLVVTKVVELRYRSKVEQLNVECQKFGHRVIMAVRNNTCLDLETVRLVMEDGKDFGVDVNLYDYFVYANCGTTGPSSKWADLPWTDVFIEKLSSRVKMSGLTLNCQGTAHLQSMVYALDRVGIRIVKNSKAIFNCMKEAKPYSDSYKLFHWIIDRYELGLSKAIIQNNFGISPIIEPTVITKENKMACQKQGAYDDIWVTEKMKKKFGRVLELNETIFFKTSRLMSASTAKEINFTLRVNW